MTNQIEKFRIERDDDIQGGWVSFDWSNGTMQAEWDDGSIEHWSRSNYSVDAKAKSFFLFTNQMDRYDAMEA